MSRIPLLAAAALLACASPLRAQPPTPALPDSVPAALAPTVWLLTMGSGDAVWERFGHNALWVQDRMGGTDYVYNYGVFDFNSPGYWGRFIRGNWLYELGVSDLSSTLYQYQMLNRTLRAQRLTLTPAQAAEVQRFLVWNARPENRVYRYDYYRDNCSTRVRDVLDRVLGGRLRAATAGVGSGTS